MVTQFSQLHIDKLISRGLEKSDIYQAIFCHSHDEEENEELEALSIFDFYGELVWANNIRDYPIHILSNINQ